jgi:CDP-diacylglycerol--glycerol-3-phosphate 3-phosphatidyltransferase
MNAPNMLTTLRIIMIPFLIYFLLAPFRGHEVVALGIFLLASLTDTVDGFWARRTNKITSLGQLLDPIADKLLMVSAFVCLVAEKHIAAWMAVIIIGREIAVTGFRALAASKGVIIPASWQGKLKMGLETATIAVLILGPVLAGKFYLAGQIGVWLTMALAVFSAGQYFRKYGPALLKESGRG